MRATTPDWQFTLKLWGDTGLTDEGWDRLCDAVGDGEIEDLIRETVRAALDQRLPKPPRDRDVPDWYTLTVTEAP